MLFLLCWISLTRRRPMSRYVLTRPQPLYILTILQKDALNALIACVRLYDPNTVSKYSITIWETLKFEILNAQEEFLSELSLQVLSSIAQRLSEGVTQISDQLPLAQFLRPITKECSEQLQEPQQKQAKPAQQILSSTSAASAASFTLIVQTVVAPLLTIYQEADGIAKQRALLDTLTVLFDSTIQVFGAWTSRDSEPSLATPCSSSRISSRTSSARRSWALSRRLPP